MKKGFITIATGSKKYYEMAKILVRSYKLSTKDPMPFAIITDTKDEKFSEFDDVVVNNGELVPSARFNYTTLPKQEYRLAGWLYRSAAAPCRR